jgi:hypothetical protein
MNLDQVVAYVSAETDAENIIAVLHAIPVWPAIRDAWGVGGQALSVDDHVRRAMNE